MKKLFAILSILLTLLFLTTAIVFWYFLSNWYDNVEVEYTKHKDDYAAELHRVVPQMKEDQKLLSKYSWLQTQRCNNDAGPILNRMIAWSGDSLDWLHENPPQEIVDWPRLTREANIQVDRVPEGEHWMDKAKRVDFSDWDFRFVNL